MRAVRAVFDQEMVSELFARVSERRVRALAADLEAYIGTNLPAAISRRSALTDYRTNPYVLMTCGSAMHLDDPMDFASFLVNNKLYMGLETSFGKSIESIVLGAYPVDASAGEAWADAPEKLAEFATYQGMSREEKARARASSVWREIDRACVVNDARYLTTIKSGPNTINDTQVNAMKDAIRDNSSAWLEHSRANYGVESIAVVLGLTYGTARTTNNKDTSSSSSCSSQASLRRIVRRSRVSSSTRRPDESGSTELWAQTSGRSSQALQIRRSVGSRSSRSCWDLPWHCGRFPHARRSRTH